VHQDQHPLAWEAYEALAEAYAARIETKPHNAYYERPATLSLLPDVQGLCILDAGCGPGVYSEWLVNHGAAVVGVDASPRMVALAQQRLSGRAEIHLADLGKPLDFLSAAAFDLVVAALILDYLADWRAVFGEFYRLLRAAGWLVFSVQHPFAEHLTHPQGSYFDLEQVEYTWRGFGTPVRMPYYRRPLQAMLGPLLGAGFQVDYLLEPQPTEEFRQADPQDYAELMYRPGFLCIRARKING
jgi:SAM-dependent methyltransferase